MTAHFFIRHLDVNIIDTSVINKWLIYYKIIRPSEKMQKKLPIIFKKLSILSLLAKINSINVFTI